MSYGFEGDLEYRLPACHDSSAHPSDNTTTLKRSDNDHVKNIVRRLPIEDSNEPVCWESGRFPLGFRPFGDVAIQRIVSCKGKPHRSTEEPIRTVLEREWANPSLHLPDRTQNQLLGFRVWNSKHTRGRCHQTCDTCENLNPNREPKSADQKTDGWRVQNTSWLKVSNYVISMTGESYQLQLRQKLLRWRSKHSMETTRHC